MYSQLIGLTSLLYSRGHIFGSASVRCDCHSYMVSYFILQAANSCFCYYAVLPRLFPHSSYCSLLMALSKSNPASPVDDQSQACSAARGTLIATRDPLSFCFVCMGLKHFQEAIELLENCSHCLLRSSCIGRSRWPLLRALTWDCLTRTGKKVTPGASC